MILCIPLMAINLLLCWVWLQLLYLPLPCKSGGQKVEAERQESVRRLLRARYEDLGSLTRHEKTVLVMFLVLVLLWMFRSPGFAPGWETLFAPGVSDAVPVMFISLLMFVIPVTEEGGTMLTWSLVQSKLSWGVIILLGGGFALAEGAERSCLTFWVGEQLSRLSFLSPQILQIIICSLVSCITQVASNVATASMILPVLIQLSTILEVNPLYLMLPATLVSSLAFFLPVSTAPNAIGELADTDLGVLSFYRSARGQWDEGHGDDEGWSGADRADRPDHHPLHSDHRRLCVRSVRVPGLGSSHQHLADNIQVRLLLIANIHY